MIEASVRVETRGQVLLITLNRPEKRNAIDFAMARGLSAALDRLDEEPNLSVGVLAAAGETYCAGLDLRAAATGERAATDKRGSLGILARPSEKPLIAAVDGAALGGGFEVVLCCDLVVASRRSIFGLPEVVRGLVAAGGGCIRLPRRLPRALAMEMILTGQPMSAERLLEAGLINRVVEAQQVVDTAIELAEVISRNSPLALSASKRIVDELGMPLTIDSATWQRQDVLLETFAKSEDLREALRAFAEKRQPVWRGR